MEQKKMMTAKTASIGKNEPAEHSLQPAADADAAEVDRSAVRALAGEHHFASLTWRGPRVALIMACGDL